MKITWNDICVVVATYGGQRAASRAVLAADLWTQGIGSNFYHGSESTAPAEDYVAGLQWAMKASDKPYILRFEDDVQVSQNFGEDSLLVANHCREPWGLITFYNGSRLSSPPFTYEPGSKFMMTQACLFHSDQIDDQCDFVLEWTETKLANGYSEYAHQGKPAISWDNAIAAWLKTRKLRYVKVFPSLVQHLQLPSMIGHHYHPNRSASSFEQWLT